MLNIALPKGRLGDKILSLLCETGYGTVAADKNDRRLIFENSDCTLRYFLVKPADVGIYVEYGAADVGVVGKDILLEHGHDVYELLDLKRGRCKVAVAAKEDYCEDKDRPLRVATKFANIAKDYYASKNREIEIVRLSGSIELAPILNMADVIVDIVETGTTLKENNLKVIEDIVPISARFIANKAAYNFKNAEISEMTRRLREVTDD